MDKTIFINFWFTVLNVCSTEGIQNKHCFFQVSVSNQIRIFVDVEITSEYEVRQLTMDLLKIDFNG